MKPWMSSNEIELVKHFLKPDMTMLEWGSGGSTVEFSPLVKKYYSIEHIKEWYNKVDIEIKVRKLNNVVNILLEPDLPRTIPTKYEEFKSYIEKIDELDEMFDVILVDGRARVQCAERAIKYLKKDGVILVHDYFRRPQYHSLEKLFYIEGMVKENQSIVALKKQKPMEISIIQPARNNLKYLKWSYDSIRKNQGTHKVEICVADDASTDGTWEWCLEMMKKDPLFKAHRNEGPKRLGHTILYDTLVNEVATKDICMIYHADMYLCSGAISAIERLIEPKTIVSLTRIEPPLHPDGPEKVLWAGGEEPEDFLEEDLQDLLNRVKNPSKVTEGIFAPWAFYKKDFQSIGGHDPLYAPQSKEDSDIFNRFQLNGVTFKQTWEGFVYHMTCRGSRRNTNDKAVNIYEDSPEWLAQNQRSTRNFIRKWGHFVMHDQLMKPIVPPKYNIGLVIDNCNLNLLTTLEPWADKVAVNKESSFIIDQYITSEQVNTIIDLSKRVEIGNTINTDIYINIDGNTFDNSDYELIAQMSSILKESGEEGVFELGNLKITVVKLNTYTDKLIKL